MSLPGTVGGVATLLIQHRVEDFDAWKRAFDNDPLGRAGNGVTGHAIYRSAEDPNEIAVRLEFSSREQAESFLPALRQLWQRVGQDIGFGGPEGVQARILDEVERVEY